MLSLNQILAQYPEPLRAHRESVLKEYLQYKILDSIFGSEYADRLAFMGGTALRILHGSSRFSEDLDFDNRGLAEQEFSALGEVVKKDLELQGVKVEIQTRTRHAYRLSIRIPGLLFDTGLTDMPEKKILIKVDTTPQYFDYRPDQPIVNKFEVFTQINAVPRNILLAQKLFASVNRNRLMGRDFFDIVFLYGIGAEPDFAYLDKYLGIRDTAELKSYMLEKTACLDFRLLAEDVSPFLFHTAEKSKVALFREFVMQKM